MQVAAVAGREPRMLLKTISYISGGDRHDQTVGRARDVPERGSHRGQPRSLTVSGTADPQVSQSAGGGAAAPQTSQADSAGSIPVSRSNTLRTTPTYGKRCRAVLDQRGIAARELTPSKDRRRLAGPDERNRRSACHKGGLCALSCSVSSWRSSHLWPLTSQRSPYRPSRSGPASRARMLPTATRQPPPA